MVQLATPYGMKDKRHTKWRMNGAGECCQSVSEHAPAIAEPSNTQYAEARKRRAARSSQRRIWRFRRRVLWSFCSAPGICTSASASGCRPTRVRIQAGRGHSHRSLESRPQTQTCRHIAASNMFLLFLSNYSCNQTYIIYTKTTILCSTVPNLFMRHNATKSRKLAGILDFGGHITIIVYQLHTYHVNYYLSGSRKLNVSFSTWLLPSFSPEIWHYNLHLVTYWPFWSDQWWAIVYCNTCFYRDLSPFPILLETNHITCLQTGAICALSNVST